MLQEALDEIASKPSAFSTTIGFRSPGDFDQTVLDHDGHAILLNENKSFGGNDIYRALFEAVTNDDAEILFVSPHKSPTRGTILQIEDALERPPFDFNISPEWTTNSGVGFSNGSRIKSECKLNNVRGSAPDHMFLFMMEMEGASYNTDEINNVLAPIAWVADTTVWVMATEMPDNGLIDVLFKDGVLVKQIDSCSNPVYHDESDPD